MSANWHESQENEIVLKAGCENVALTSAVDEGRLPGLGLQTLGSARRFAHKLGRLSPRAV